MGLFLDERGLSGVQPAMLKKEACRTSPNGSRRERGLSWDDTPAVVSAIPASALLVSYVHTSYLTTYLIPIYYSPWKRQSLPSTHKPPGLEVRIMEALYSDRRTIAGIAVLALLAAVSHSRSPSLPLVGKHQTQTKLTRLGSGFTAS